MKKYIVILLLLVIATVAPAQRRHRFDPKRFEIELRQYITQQAGLTPREAAAFFPIFNEMQDKQRLLFEKMRQYRFVDTKNNKASLNAIKQMDKTDIEIKELQRKYHLKFCKVLPAGKVLEVIKADEQFHRRAFKRMMRRSGQRKFKN